MGSIDNDFASEPIAVIGLGCRFAGDATNPKKFWKVMAEGRSAWSEFPSSRLNPKGFYHPNHERLSTTHVKGGFFMEEDLGMFDAAFFGFSGETAATLDPQFRLLLESVYEALENAGVPIDELIGSDTSVFSGIFVHDYKDSMMRDEDNVPRFYPTGTGLAMASNRISHFFDLRGASMTIDTGCSTTLVALHQAVQNLRNGYSGMSIVGGSNLLLNPDMFKTMSSLGLLSPDGKSYAFDSRANGYARGEGSAAIVIKLLKDAVAAGDPIRGVIRETFLNQDGKTETITSPSQSAQEALMRECYRRAGIDPLGTQYFEAHGTGTPTGDPIEARAVGAIFKPGRPTDQPLLIGSVKTNIGHTESVSGLASLIKVILAMEKGVIPPSINFEKPNPKLALEDWCLKVVRGLEKWPETPSGVRRTSVNSFGYGGTNAHVIVEGAASWLEKSANGTNGHLNGVFSAIKAANGATKQNGDANGTNSIGVSTLPRQDSKLLILSARDEPTCQKIVSNLKEFLEENKESNTETFLQSLVYTLGQRRTIFPWVAAYPVPITQDINEVIAALESPKFKPSRTSRQPRIGMVFTGQGAQWNAMGRELITAYPVFKASLEEADGFLRQLGADWSLIEELSRDAETTRVNETGLSIPICVSVQISLVRLLRAWGITPTAVTSHSSGEIAAAYTVGAVSYKAAMAIAYYRSILAADKNLRGPVKGGMIAVGLGLEDAERYLERLTSGSKVVVACVNSPSSVTLAGDLSGVQEIENMAKLEDIFARRLKVDTGYHSHHMSPIAAPYLKALQSMPAEDPSNDSLDSIAFSSPVTGGRVTSAAEIANADHWVASLVQPVQFVDALTDMILGDFDPSGSSVDVIVEVGPHTALGGPIRQTLTLLEFNGIQLPYFGCLVRNSNAQESMQALVANLLREGYPIDMEAVNFPCGRPSDLRVLTELPSYPWNHQNKHWFENRFNRALRERAIVPHDLLGSLALGTNIEAPSWRHTVRVHDVPWIRDHVVQSNMLYPGAGFVSLAIEAMTQLTGMEAETANMAQTNSPKEISGYRLRDIEILLALVVPDNAEGIEIQTTLHSVSDKDIGLQGWKRFEVFSVTRDNRWTRHAYGLISVEFDGAPNATPTILEKNRGITGYARLIDPGDMFASLRSVGINHGPIFQNIKGIVQSGKEQRCICTFAVADTSVPNDLPRSHVIHPTTLDSVVLAAYAALHGVGSHQETAKVPRTIEKLWISSRISHNAGHSFKAYSTISYADSQSIHSNISVVDDGNSDDATPVLEIQNLTCQSLGRSGVSEQVKPWEKELCYKLKWDTDMSLASSATLESLKKKLIRDADPDEGAIITHLRRVCIYFMQDAIVALTKSDVKQLDIHHAKFYKWMESQVQLASSGKLGSSSARWMLDSVSERKHWIDLAAKASVNGEMVCRLGPQIAAMLRREKVPMELMMEDKLLHKYYREALKGDRAYDQLSTLLRSIVHKNPQARILEIGASSGERTKHTLKTLGTADSGGSLASLYHFTDTSPGFFEAAREEFAPWNDLLAFDRLDIEQDPASQGFELGSYDIVIAGQCLHAAKSVAQAMANVRSLMKPGGKLLVVETTQDQIDVQLVFSLLPDWWLSKEPERASSPSLSVPLWDQILKGAGFTGVDIDIHDCESDDLYSVSTIMSTVPTQPPRLVPESIVLVVSSKAPPPPSWLVSMQRSIAAGGSLPVVQTLEAAKPTMYSGKICIFVGEVFQPILHNLDAVALEGIRAFTTSCKGLIWVTRGGSVDCEQPEFGLAPGFLRSIRNEYVGRKFLTLDLDPKAPVWSDTNVVAIMQVLKMSFGNPDDAYLADAPAVEFEFAERDGAILVPRCYKDLPRNKIVMPEAKDSSSSGVIPSGLFQQEDRPLSLTVGIPGLLDTLAFGDDPWNTAHGSSLPANYIEIEPRAYGVNFRDVMVAMGQLNERVMGLECAGIVTRVGSEAATHGYSVGDHVFSLLRGPFGSRAHIEWSSAMHMPVGLSFEEAASLPIIFCTAYACLIDIARLERGQSVLIHAAAGGVGQAAIMLAQHIGAEIYATVGSQEKRDLIVQKYGIPNDHIFNSRDRSFAADIIAATDGRGVDVVLNSLAGPLLQESFNVLADYGHFVEIGKRDLELNSSLEMAPFCRQASFSAFNLLAVITDRPAYTHRIMTQVARLVKDKIISPIPIITYSLADIAKAFRLLQTGKHTGKVVLSISSQEMVPVLPRTSTVKLSPNASYLLVGGVGGIGRSVANWLATHGARNIVLLSRSAATNEKTGAMVAELQEAGCRVKPISCDVSSAADLAKAVQLCGKEGLPPIRGVIQSAMVLQDSILEQMTILNWKDAISPKVNATWNLHKQFEEVDLDFFVILSSISGIVGYASQSNYSAGGAYEDALAHWRVACGLPAVSIDLGAVKNVGYVAETAGVAGRMIKAGNMLLSEEQVLGILESAILNPYEPQVITGINSGPGSQWDRDGESQLGRDARFLALKYRRSQQQGDDRKVGGSGSLASELLNVSSQDEATHLVSAAIAQKLADIFMMPITDVDLAKHPASYGVDSLVAVELRNMLAMQAAAEVSIFEIMQSSSLAALASEVVAKSAHVLAALMV